MQPLKHRCIRRIKSILVNAAIALLSKCRADGLAGLVNKFLYCILIVACCGCRSAKQYQFPALSVHTGAAHQDGGEDSLLTNDECPVGSSVCNTHSAAGEVSAVSVADTAIDDTVVAVSFSHDGTEPEPETEPAAATSLQLSDVVMSVHQSYPLVSAAFQERSIADGNRVSAWGSFDTKLKASSESGPLGYYETYRNSAGLTKPIYSGGEFFAGYRIGDGDFQPWYKERETNEGGEFKAGVRIPLIRDRDIDGRRADLWRASYDRQIADPVIRTQLVLFSREAGLAYWKWVAAGEKFKLGQRWVALAADRNQRIIDQKEAGQLALADVQDNEAAIAKRRAKLADIENELRQAAVKLSLYVRDSSGNPVLPLMSQSPGFPALRDCPQSRFSEDIPQAQAMRPELQALALQIQKLEVDYSEAYNMTLAALDAQLIGAQDVGFPASSKRDKSEFELEAGLFFDVPLERRKGRGKMDSVRAKMAAVHSKRRMVQDKVSAEVQAVYVALQQTQKQVEQAAQSVDLYQSVAENERVLFENGESDLLKVALREQYALEAAEGQIAALYNHFVAFTEYAAVMAIDRPDVGLLPPAPVLLKAAE